METKDYVFIQANTRYLLGHQSTDDFYERFCNNREWHGADMAMTTDDVMALHRITDEHNVIKKAQGQPFVFCSFHYGPYYHLAMLLNRLGVSCVLSGNAQASLKQYLPEGIDYIDSGRPDAGVDFLERLSNGQSVFIMLDGGHIAPQDFITRKAFKEVPFLDKTCFVRKGMAYTAWLANVPIVPVIAVRQPDGGIDTTFYAPVLPEKKVKNMEAFSQEALTTCFSLFEPYITYDPAQWESWPHWHYFMKLPEAQTAFPMARPFFPEYEYGFNTERYGLYQQDNKYYLADKESFSGFSISATLYEHFRRLKHLPVKGEVLAALIKPLLIEELISKQILIIKHGL
ncbi:MAG TPA: hypothetical protein VJ720_07625 [Chitinophaga sp.]|nr:hypothetical protein [Chitinophaga sp.]